MCHETSSFVMWKVPCSKKVEIIGYKRIQERTLDVISHYNCIHVPFV